MNDIPDTCLARVPRNLKPVIEALVRLHTGNGAAGDVERLVKVLAPHYRTYKEPSDDSSEQ